VVRQEAEAAIQVQAGHVRRWPHSWREKESGLGSTLGQCCDQ
jgi:hypothetical protein